ncbi:hypothetical protein C8D87_104281 [Lentzea atacamensis]|uniref:Uncharacterized protein n=1 Tax=Lentzea atacamensis TaxID=531938 RepID=A0ABX9EAD7_9PSEU|nr:hypothetical protein [Lentzea atacamensis]RAS65730.1 hypothetical protein C8D87_104281 [Lentzea atacamensis]
MSVDQNSILLLSSNVRRRYSEDILTALALPSGAMIQFRYETDYVSPTLQRTVASGSIVSSAVTIAFVAETETDNPFLLPVRHAKVISAVCVADIFIFRLQVGSYVNLGDFPRNEGEIRNRSRVILDQVTAANKRYYPAVTSFPDLHMRESVDPAGDWLSSARRLVLHSTFSNSYFLRIDPPTTQTGSPLTFNSDGRLEVVDRESVRIHVSFYSGLYAPERKHVLSCTTDGTFLRVSSDDSYEVALRYDSVEFWLHPGSLDFNTLSRVTISLTGEQEISDFVPTHARFPVVVKRSASRLTLRVATTALGALLVALPAILGASSPLAVRIAIGLVGAALLATSTVVLGSTTK